MKKVFIILFFLSFSFNLNAFIDLNNNGIMDSWEKLYNISDPSADPDNDSLTNLEEFLRQSNPLVKDEIGANLLEINGVNTDGQTSDIAYNDKYLFVADGDKGIKVYDKKTLKLIADNSSINANQIQLKKDYLFVVNASCINCGGDIYIYKFEKGNLIYKNKITSFDNNFWHDIYKFKIFENYLYILSEFYSDKNQYSLLIYDITDRENPVFKNEFIFNDKNAYEAVNFIIENNLMYIIGKGNIDGNDKTYLRILDISDRENPEEKSFKIFENSGGCYWYYSGVAKKGNYLLIGNNNNVLIVDVSDPENPVYKESVFINSVSSIRIKGNYAYMIGNCCPIYLYVYDISNILNPVMKYSYFIENYNSYNYDYDIKIDNNYLYVPFGGKGFKVFRTDYFPIPTNFNDNKSELIYINNLNALNKQKLVIFNFNGNTKKLNKFIDIYEFDNNSHTVLLKRYYLDGTLIKSEKGKYSIIFNGKAARLDIDNRFFILYIDRTFLAKGENGKYEYIYGIITNKDKTDKNIVKEYNLNLFLVIELENKNISEIALKDNFVYLLKEDYIYIYKFEKENLILKNKIQINIDNNWCNIYKFKIFENYLYILSMTTLSNSGENQYYLLIFDISNPVKPLFKNKFELKGAGGYNFIIENNLMYIIGDALIGENSKTSLRILDITNRENPVEKSFKIFENSGYIYNCYGIAKKGNYLLIGNGDNVLIVDVSNPENPIYKKSIFSGGLTNIIIKDNFAYTYFNWGYFNIYDISNILNPIQKFSLYIGNEGFGDENYNMEIKDNFIFLSSGYNGFFIFDISNPEKAKLFYHIKTDTYGKIYDLQIYNNYLFVVDGNEGLKVYDLYAFDKDFDGIPDKYDLYPEDSSKYFGDIDGDGKIDEIIDNKTLAKVFINSSNIVGKYKFDEDSFKLQVLTSDVSLNNIVHKLAYEYKKDNYSITNFSVINVLSTQSNECCYEDKKFASIFKYSVNSFNYSILKELYTISKSTNAIPEAEEEDKAFNLSTNQSYSDIFSVINNEKWFILPSNTTQRLNLLFATQEGLSSLVKFDKTKPAKIKITIYKKTKEGSSNKEIFGTFTFNPKSNLRIPLTVNEKYNYIVKLEKENIKQWKYYISVVSEPYLYFENFKLDENGNGYFDFIAPNSDSYNILINSPEGDFTCGIYLDRRTDEAHKMIEDNSTKGEIKKILGLLAGIYRLKIKGKPNQKIQLLIWYSNQKREIEPNNTISTATRFADNIQGVLEKNDFDIFQVNVMGSFTFTINSKDFEDGDEVDIDILSQNGALLNSLFEFAENGKINTTMNVGNGLKFIKIINASDKRLRYTLLGANPPQSAKTDREIIYEANYKNYLLGLPTNLVYEKQQKEEGDAGNLIILAGVGDKSDPLYEASNNLAKSYYKIFNYRGLSDDDIYYFSFEKNIDVDGDGIIDNVVDDDTPSAEEFYNVITGWAENTGKKGPLYIYMVDHGGIGAFKVKDGDIVFASQLREKLDDFYNATGRQIVLIIEACKSGTFIDYMKDADYITVITSSKGSELSFIDSEGTVSFSLIFGRKLFSGMNIEKAFKSAVNELPNYGEIYEKQHPELKVANNEIGNMYVGENFVTADMQVVSISSAGADNNISDGKIDLWLKPNGNKGIKQVWAVVFPPDFQVPQEVKDYQSIDLTPFTVNLKYDEKEGRYQGEFDNASVNGDYNITYYIKDTDGNVVSKSITINAKGAKEELKCNKNNLNLCKTKEECENAGGYWEKIEGCKSEKEFEETECSVDNLTACNTEEKCINIGKYWYNNKCNNDPLYQENFKLKLVSGWNLKGLPIDSIIGIEKFDNSNIITVWKWVENSWRIWSPNDNIKQLVSSYGLETINELNSGDGFWINSKINLELEIGYGEEYGVEKLQINSGWNLLGIGKKINVNELGDIKTVWKWTGANWEIWSPNNNIIKLISKYGLSTFNQIERGSGFWVNK